MEKTKQAAVKEREAIFTKRQLADSKRYACSRDLVCALLEDGRGYRAAEVDELIENFKKGKVN